MRHRHFWVGYCYPAFGIWEKRDIPGGTVRFQGRAEKCACQEIRFVCDDPRMRIVEVDPLEKAFKKDGLIK